MNEQQNVNSIPKVKKKRSFWWLKLLLILILFAGGVIAGVVLSSQEITNQLLERYFPQYAVTQVVPSAEPAPSEKPIEFKPAVTPKPTPSKAPVEIISPEAQQKEEDKLPESAEPITSPELSVESPLPSSLPAFASVTESPVPSPVTEPVRDGGYIGVEAAVNAALEHAGVDTEKAIVYSVSREKDDGLVYYEVEFAFDGREYEYEINAFTAVVEGWKSEREGREAQPKAEGNAQDILNVSEYIGAEEAKATALFHAGYKAHETTDMKVSLEIENNKVVYAIEFWAEGYDYDYTVDASSGLVIRVEKERD